MEILQSVNEDETVVCNLGSVNFARVPANRIYDATCVLYRMLDNVIDLSMYPTKKSKDTQLGRRAIGCGFMGHGEAIANLGIMYGSSEHMNWLDEVMTPYNQALGDSNKALGAERGSFPQYKGNSTKRNAYMFAGAPTASISIIAGTTPLHEPVFAYKWTEDGLVGQTTVTAPNINPDNYPYYVSAYDVDQLVCIDVVAKIQGFSNMDQGISHNIHMRPDNVTAGKIAKVIKHAHKSGVKTLYYFRSKSLKATTSLSDTVACTGCQ